MSLEISIHNKRRNGNTGKTHCKRGHSFDADNTYLTKSGRRCCKECRRQFEKTTNKPYMNGRLRLMCKRGHSFDTANTYILPSSGLRFCKACKAIREATITREQRNQFAANWRKRNPEQVRIAGRREQLKAFGLTIEAYEERVLRQGGVCAICNNVCKSGMRLAVDHCHATGVIRGLLCGNCNRGVGFFQDSPKLLLAAIGYLTPEHPKEGNS